MSIKIKIKILNSYNLPLPSYATKCSAGMDLMAAVDTDIVIKPGSFQLVPTGIAIALPEGYEAQIRPRSGLALKHGITILNTPGTVDADYRGEIKVILLNLGQEEFVVNCGMRIAQMVIAECIQADFEFAETLPESLRGYGGFGSTGIKSHYDLK